MKEWYEESMFKILSYLGIAFLSIYIFVSGCNYLRDNMPHGEATWAIPVRIVK